MAWCAARLAAICKSARHRLSIYKFIASAMRNTCAASSCTKKNEQGSEFTGRRLPLRRGHGQRNRLTLHSGSNNNRGVTQSLPAQTTDSYDTATYELIKHKKHTGLSGTMSALLSLHRAAVCRRNGRSLLLTLSRQNSRLFGNVWPSSGGVRGVLRRLANGRQVLLSKSEQRPASQQQSLIQVG